MGARRGQINVAHAVTPDLGLGDFNATLLANDTAVFQALVLAAQALIVLDGAEDFCAKESIALGLEGSVVDGFWFFDLAKRPRTDLLRRGNADFDGIKMLIGGELLEQVQE